MRAVNLLPRDDSTQKGGLPAPPILAACVGAVLMSALLAVMFLSASGKVAQQQRALDDAQATYSALPVPAAPSAAETALPQLRATRVTALASALGQRVAWDRLLREVSQVVPSDVWLLTLDAQAPSTAAAATTTPGTTTQTFTVTGCTYSQDSVARFLARLEVVPDLSDMTLGKSEAGTETAGGDGSAASSTCPRRMITFGLQGSVRGGGAAAS
jgi:Tfp pilus assembly protein PilN